MKTVHYLLTAGLMIIAAVGCKPTQSALSAFTDSASPGEHLILKIDSDQGQPNEVLFGDTKARIISAQGEYFTVMVPQTKPGKTTIAMVADGKVISKTPFEILPPPSKLVIVQIDSDSGTSKLIKMMDSNDRPDAAEFPDSPFYFSITNKSGNSMGGSSVILGGSQSREYFSEEKDQMARESIKGTITVAVRIPYDSSIGELEFFLTPDYTKQEFMSGTSTQVPTSMGKINIQIP